MPNIKSAVNHVGVSSCVSVLECEAVVATDAAFGTTLAVLLDKDRYVVKGGTSGHLFGTEA